MADKDNKPERDKLSEQDKPEVNKTSGTPNPPRNPNKGGENQEGDRLAADKASSGYPQSPPEAPLNPPAAEAVGAKGEQKDEPKSKKGRPDDQTDTPEGMHRVRVTHKFNLARDDGTVMAFNPGGTNCGLPGFYDVSEEDYNHPYLRVSVGLERGAPPAPGSKAYEENRAKEAARRQVIEAALEQERQDAARQKREEQAERIEKGLGSSFQRNS